VQITGETVGEVKPVADMHQRKAEMARQSDAFIALPGNIEIILIMHQRKAEMARQSDAFIALPGNIEIILINIRLIFNYQAESRHAAIHFLLSISLPLSCRTACVVEA
jgi:hypothetical protein